MKVRFWGVRGTIACGGRETVRYGGNTSCVEVRCGERLLILDGGTGLRPLGEALGAASSAVDADLMLSHCHLDHIIGLPLFQPFYAGENRFRLWAGHLLPQLSLVDVMHSMMAAPLFPVPPDVFKAQVEYRDFTAGELLHPQPGVVIRTGPLNHPDGATGYRIEHGGAAVAYITATEHRPGERDANVLALARAADLLIYDCTYTDEEYPAHAGWGHSTWQEGVRLADASGAKTLVVFHHDPSHDDATMDRSAAASASARAGTVVAREGDVLQV